MSHATLVRDHDTIFYHVRPGDSLSAIIRSYHGSVSSARQSEIIAQIKADNPQMRSVDRIYPGESLILDIPRKHPSATPGYCPVPTLTGEKSQVRALQESWTTATLHEKELLSTLAPLMLGAGSAGMMMLDMTFRTNAPLVGELVENYNQYHAGRATKGQYDHRRLSTISRLRTKLGPTGLLLHGRQSPNEVLRISRTHGSAPTEPLERQLGKMTRLSKLAARSGVVLSVAGLGVACHDIASTSDSRKKNEILVEALGGFAGGVLYGAAATAAVLVMATPVGWVGALVIGVGGAVSGAAAGYGLRTFYTTYGTHVDIADATGVARLCSR